MRLIDADALKAVFEEKSSEAVCGVELCKAIISRIDEAPTVDAVTLADIIEVEKERNYWHDLSDSYERTILKLSNALQESVPVRHGKWIDIDEQTYTWKIRCSCCGNERSMLSTQGKYPNYCEACGARMDKDE